MDKTPTPEAINLEKIYSAQNYKPLPVVLTRGEGVYLWDEQGRKYLDMMSAYSAVSHGHGHPRLLAVLQRQAQQLAMTSRAYYSDQLAPFVQKICQVTGLDRVLPMNTGAEAVETAIKGARRWGYEHKKIPENQAKIIVAKGNFHGRTTTIIGFSSEESYKRGFGPFAPGFVAVPFGDAEALEQAITPETCAVLIEPIQGEAGIIVPPPDYLHRVRAACDRHGVLLILDEIQSGLGRTGKMFCYEHAQIKPDGLTLGKALGGGLLPVSAFVATEEVMSVFNPGSHGSTFGGNPLAAAVGLEAIKVIEEEGLIDNSARMGAYLLDSLRKINSDLVRDVRGKGLWVGVDFDPEKVMAREICERLMVRGVLSKETHETVVRFAPPLTITKEQIDHGVEQLRQVISEV